jgi:transposase InsO family protein
VRFTERLDEIGARPSIGTIADSFDNALAETTSGLYKAECVYGPDAPQPWDDVDELELATLSWCTGSTRSASTATATTSRPPSSLLPNSPPQPRLETNRPSLQQSQGGSYRRSPPAKRAAQYGT